MATSYRHPDGTLYVWLAGADCGCSNATPFTVRHDYLIDAARTTIDETELWTLQRLANNLHDCVIDGSRQSSRNRRVNAVKAAAKHLVESGLITDPPPIWRLDR